MARPARSNPTESLLQISEVPLSAIDRDDRRFQYRISYGIKDLVDSLRAEGQQVPITLWGVHQPYTIIDGFRRVEALLEIGVPTVHAVVRSELDENRAVALSFTENAKRRNFSTLDKAHAVWVCAHQRGMNTEEIAKEFGLSERQVHRYRQLLDLPAPLVEALNGQRISMAHAIEMRHANRQEIEHLIDMIEVEELSVQEVRRKLGRRRRGARPRFLVKDGPGYRMRPISFRPSLDQRTKQEMLEALERLAGIVRESMGDGVAARERGYQVAERS